MQPNITRDYRLDTIKTVMILGIIVEHSLIIYGYPRNHELFWGLCISWLMPMFTLISGYLYKKRNLKELLSKYLYPMVLFSALIFAIGYFFYDNYHSGLNIIGYAMWYLWALFWFNIITPPLLKIIEIQLLIVVSIIAVAIYALLPLPNTLAMIGNKLQLNRIVGFFPFYLLGILLKDKDWLKKGAIVRWRIFLISIIAVYIFTCYFVKGFAYKSGFYLAPSSSMITVFQFFISYVFIMTICVALIQSVPNKALKISVFGSRTLNVYLLHMLVVFPVCYGIFKHLNYNAVNVVLNSISAVLLCLVFFTKKCDSIIKRILNREYWGMAAILYVLSLILVNSSLITKILN